MEVRPGYSSRATHSCHDFSSSDRLSLPHQISFVMGVDRNDSPRMANDHNVSVTAQLIAIDNFPCFSRSNRRTFGCGDIYAVMETRAPRSEA